MQSDIHVLIVDDNKNVRETLKAVLQIMPGIDVVGVAQNGQEAVELVKKLNPDVVLMDLEMPVMDGMKAAQKIKSKSLETRVIIFSIHNDESTKRKARMSGADRFVEKGIPIHQLKNTIVSLCKKSVTKKRI